MISPTMAHRTEAMSKALRHRSAATTQRLYAPIQAEQAWDTLELYWATPKVETVGIRKKRNRLPKA